MVVWGLSPSPSATIFGPRSVHARRVCVCYNHPFLQLKSLIHGVWSRILSPPKLYTLPPHNMPVDFRWWKLDLRILLCSIYLPPFRHIRANVSFMDWCLGDRIWVSSTTVHLCCSIPLSFTDCYIYWTTCRMVENLEFIQWSTAPSTLPQTIWRRIPRYGFKSL